MTHRHWMRLVLVFPVDCPGATTPGQTESGGSQATSDVTAATPETFHWSTTTSESGQFHRLE